MPRPKPHNSVFKKNKQKSKPDYSDAKTKGVYLTGDQLLNTLRKVHGCCKVSPDFLTLVEVAEERAGHSRALKVLCRNCDLDVYVDKDPSRKATTFRESTATNRAFAFAADVAELDFEQLKLFCGMLNIPSPPDSFDSVHQAVIYDEVQNTVRKMMEENRAHSYQQSAHKTADGRAIIAVKTDGTYQKRGDRRRGYTSKIAVVTLTDAYTQRFLDFRVLANYCHKCTQLYHQYDEAEFALWQEKHIADGECQANYTGP